MLYARLEKSCGCFAEEGWVAPSDENGGRECTLPVCVCASAAAAAAGEGANSRETNVHAAHSLPAAEPPKRAITKMFEAASIFALNS